MLKNLWRTRRVPLLIGIGVVVIALAAGAFALGSGGGSNKSPAASKQPAVHRKELERKKSVRTAPLTGLPDETGASFKRPAVTVKVNNTSAARQYGIDQADVVYEEVVEGGYTRLAAVFNSHSPDKVGPVRSVRKTDQSIVWPIGGVFAYSGGADYAIQSIDTAPVTQLDETRAGSMMYRDPNDSRYAPFNLWARVDQMYQTKAKPVPPPPLFAYRSPRSRVTGTPITAFIVGFQGLDDNGMSFAVTWTWDAKSGDWLRSKFGAPDIDGGNVRLAPKNVVVMFVQYAGGAGAEGSEAQLTGTGDAWVFTAGKEIKGHWSRPDKAKPARLTDANGHEIRLTPGQTWVELPDTSYQVAVLPSAKPSA